MSSQLFDAQLLVPDDNASHRQLVDLVTAGKYTGRGLPDSAHKYLDAFCNKSNSKDRRRWAGIALVGMMRASASVVQRIKKLSRGPLRIGAILLDRNETEERRIIAGLIIRQGLEAGIDFADFWESSKLLDSAPTFPKNSSEDWMSQFQTYLDTLSELLLADLNTEAVIVYPISLSTVDGFQWIGRSAVALLEENVLKMVLSNSMLTDFQFIDIPLNNIKDMSLQKDTLHESQEVESGHRMYSLVVDLQGSSPNYLLNSYDHTTSEFKASFQTLGDADELRNGFLDIRQTFKAADTVAGAAESMGSSSPSHTLHGKSTQRIDADVRPEHEDNGNDILSVSSAEAMDVYAPPERSAQRSGPTQHASQEKNKGKLPSISKATKQKVTQAERLPSVPLKGTKARAVKKAAPVFDTSDDEDGCEEVVQDEFDVRPAAKLRTSIGSGNTKKGNARRKRSAEDEEFIPNGSKAKSTSAKRKRGSSDAAEPSRPTKKTQKKASTSTKPPVGSGTAKTPEATVHHSGHIDLAGAQEATGHSSPPKNSRDGESARHSLIGGLLNSTSPSKSAPAAFKKPGQPASTPARPRAKPVRTTPKPQTPIGTSRDMDGFPIHASSTPRSQTIHEEDFGLGYVPVDTEILSSNTKRVPDSPHAESTAISGHADQVDVHREKCIADMETAKSDPFQQRRQGQRTTVFTRKLTGESLVDDDAGREDLLSMPVESRNDNFDVDQLVAESASQSLLKDSPSLFKHRTQNLPAQIRNIGDLPTDAQKPRKTTTTKIHEKSRLFGLESAERTNALQDNPASTQRNATVTERSSPVPVAATQRGRCKTKTNVDKQAELDDSVISAPQEVVEDTLPEAADQQENLVNMDGETTLVGEEVDMPEQFVVKAAGLHFRSSPPIPDSSSVRDASDESEAELQASPPTSRADELEWEQSLEPHQRDLHEQLLRTSKRVVRHIVDNETAVTDITETFANDGERLLDLLLERQSNESAEAFQDLTSKRQNLLKELSDASKNLKLQRKQVKALE
ncbi:hypothetical protein OPT61_g2121 [Boeremia exigua]|uniref:Uncharacterized protein n=1 Tax=Boeremia exigua TaxID=749465 RepID=A0ACC2IMQ8_9PLEO|nr:hypothetical protein OPT61_g2121 [Boeremia exigua]